MTGLENELTHLEALDSGRPSNNTSGQRPATTTHTNTHITDSTSRDESLKLSQENRPQQRSEDDVRSLHVHQVIIKIIIVVVVVVFISSPDQAAPQTTSLSLHLIWANDGPLTNSRESVCGLFYLSVSR